MSCGGILSPVMMIAGAGMIPGASSLGASLGVSGALTSSIGSFTSLPITSQFSSIVTSASSVLGSGTLDSLRTLASSTFPALTNAIPADFTSALSTIAPGGMANGGLTGLISSTASGIMGNGDLSKFTQVFSSAQGYLSQANQYLSSTLSATGLADTFNQATGGMDTLMTGAFSQVSDSLGPFGTDLKKLGGLIDLNNLNNLGNPSQLLSRVSALSGGEIPGVNQILSSAGVSLNSLNSLANGTLAIDGISPSAQKLLYQGMTKIAGPELAQVKSVLGVTQTGINTMADLLNPQKILPNSFGSLQIPTPDGLSKVYNTVNQVSSINTNIEKVLKIAGKVVG